MAQGHEIAISVFEMQADIALKYGIHIGERTIQVVGEINQEMFILVDTALTILEAQSKAQIVLRINSEGGSIYDALAIVGRIKKSKCLIVTEGFGAIMSAAGLILASGGKRRMSKYAWFMFHEAWAAEMGGTVQQLKHQAIQLEREWDTWAEVMAEFTTTNKSFWLDNGNLGKDLYLSAEQCLELGIIDEVI